MIAIVDYGAGNLRSVVNAIAKLGYKPEVTHKPEDLLKARAVILPGLLPPVIHINHCICPGGPIQSPIISCRVIPFQSSMMARDSRARKRYKH